MFFIDLKLVILTISSQPQKMKVCCTLAEATLECWELEWWGKWVEDKNCTKSFICLWVKLTPNVGIKTQLNTNAMFHKVTSVKWGLKMVVFFYFKKGIEHQWKFRKFTPLSYPKKTQSSIQSWFLKQLHTLSKHIHEGIFMKLQEKNLVVTLSLWKKNVHVAEYVQWDSTLQHLWSNLYQVSTLLLSSVK